MYLKSGALLGRYSGMKFFMLVFVSFFSIQLFAEDYPRFDGRKYNGLYYPRMNIIEWQNKESEPFHLQFQIYQKDPSKKIDIMGQTVESGGKNIFIAAIDMDHRGERLCRRVVAPSSFKPKSKLYYYIDKSDKDMNNIIVSSQPMSQYEPYTPKPLQKCVEIKAYSQQKKQETQVAVKDPQDTEDDPEAKLRYRTKADSSSRVPANIEITAPKLKLDQSKKFADPEPNGPAQKPEYYEAIPNNFNMYSF